MAFDDRTERPMENQALVDDLRPVAENHRELSVEPLKALGRITSQSQAVEIHLGQPPHRPLAAALAGTAGVLMTQTTGFASLDLFDIHRSADVLLMLVIGGTGWLYGGIFGAVVFKVLQDVLSSITPQYWTFWLGLFLVVLVLVGRERLVSPLSRAAGGRP